MSEELEKIIGKHIKTEAAAQETNEVHKYNQKPADERNRVVMPIVGGPCHHALVIVDGEYECPACLKDENEKLREKLAKMKSLFQDINELGEEDEG